MILEDKYAEKLQRELEEKIGGAPDHISLHTWMKFLRIKKIF